MRVNTHHDAQSVMAKGQKYKNVGWDDDNTEGVFENSLDSTDLEGFLGIRGGFASDSLMSDRVAIIYEVLIPAVNVSIATITDTWPDP